MSKENVFIIEGSDYDESRTYILYGPDNTSKEDFIDLCESVLPKAGRNVLERESKNDTNPIWIGWFDILEELASVLSEKGFELIQAKSYMVNSCACIVRGWSKENMKTLGTVGDEIVKYNKDMEKREYGSVLE
jgi:hypothetical protein